MHRYSNLMVGLSGASADAALVRYAAMIARCWAVQSIRFTRVMPRAAQPEEQSGDELRTIVQPHLGALPDSVAVAYDVLSEPLTDSLLARVAEREIDLLLVGQSLGNSSRRALPRRLAMKAPCSVWIVPDEPPSSLRRILVPIDFSEHAADTMQVAVSLARLCGNAECLALHVYFNEAVTIYEEYDQVLRGQEEEAYRRFIAPIDMQGIAVKPIFEESADVANVIARVAQREQAELIVMGTRGRSRSAAILLGSVTEEAIMDTQVPLLAVKHFGARMGVLQALLDRRFVWSRGVHTH